MKKLFFVCLLFMSLPLWAGQKHISGFSIYVNHPGFELKKNYSKNRFIIAYKTPLKINGTLNNSVITVGNGMIVNGKVKKNILALKSNVRIKSCGVVEGNIISLGGRVVLEKGAQAKKLNFSVLITLLRMTGTFAIFLIYLSFVILGLFFNFYFIKNFVFISDQLKTNFLSYFIIGIFALPLSLLACLALAGTVIGSLFLPALFFIFIFYFFFSFYTIAIMLGEQFMKLFTFRDRPYFEQFLGISLFFFLILIPYIGLPLFIIFLLTGLGAVVKLKFGAR